MDGNFGNKLYGTEVTNVDLLSLMYVHAVSILQVHLMLVCSIQLNPTNMI